MDLNEHFLPFFLAPLHNTPPSACACGQYITITFFFDTVYMHRERKGKEGVRERLKKAKNPFHW